jgi:hypothetical protein
MLSNVQTSNTIRQGFFHNVMEECGSGKQLC